MSTYTIDEKNIYFLNDKNIASSLTVDKVNAIPSLDLIGDLSSTVDGISSNLVDALKGYANGISSELSDTIDANREVDKVELSGTLSSYANSLCANLSAAVEQNRKADRDELNGALSTYTNTKIQQLSTDLSTQVDREFVHISGDTIDHLDVNGRLSVDKMLNIDPSTNNIGIKANVGIDAGGQNIGLTSEILSASINHCKIYCNEDNLLINNKSLTDIQKSLSVANFSHTGNRLILTLADARELAVPTDDFIKDGMISSVTYDEDDHIVHIVWNTAAGGRTTDINLSGLIDTYYAGEGLSTAPGTLNTFCVNFNKVASKQYLDSILSSLAHDVKFEGHLEYSKDDSGITIEKMLLPYVESRSPIDTLKNGLMLEFRITDDKNARFKINPRGDAVSPIDEPITVGDGDVIILHQHESGDIPMNKIYLTGDQKTVFVFHPAIPRYEFNETINNLSADYVWLSGDNTRLNNHAITGDNDFLGTTTVTKMIALSTVCLSDNLNVAKDVALLANVSIGNNLTITSGLTAENISAGTINVNWANVINPTNGYSLFDLSSALSNKIWISSYIPGDQMSGTSDLSIVKLSKEEFDSAVASDSIMCANTLYVVDSDYIDAYGQVLSNVSMKNGDEYKLGIAATDTYVNEICAGLSTEIKQLSADLSGEIDKLSANLSSAISAKIFISSYLNDDCMSGYSDLSIVKLSKNEFDNLAANDDSIMCANTLYVVDSDYIDAYGQAISNVVMDDLSGKTPSEATNKTYVDAKIGETEKYVNAQIESLSNALSAISNAIKSDPILSSGIDNESEISSVISAVVLLFKQLSAI